jgi:hypothetical protein
MKPESTVIIRILTSSVLLLGLNLLLVCEDLAADPCGYVQTRDPEFKPKVNDPVYASPEVERPLVVIDSAHHNFNTIEGRYKPFAELLVKDGFIVESSKGKYNTFNKTALDRIDVLVVANALHNRNVDDEICTANWKLPVPSAFEDAEIKAVLEWVRAGGSLMLIADHMPFAGAAKKLANALGFTLGGGITLYANDVDRFIEFVSGDDSADGLLVSHPILKGRRGKSETVSSVVSFNGEAFWIRSHSKSKPQALMILGEEATTYYFSDANEFSEEILERTPSISSFGMLQGATLRLGKGRVAIFGEAAMFSAQLVKEGELKLGMNNPDASQNMQFTLNVLHWLSGILPADSD